MVRPSLVTHAHQGVEEGSQPPQLLEVGGGQGLDPFVAQWRQSHTDQALVVWVVDPFDEAEGGGSLHQADGAVMTYEQVVGDVGDGRALAAGMSPHGDQQLVLCRAQPDRRGLRLAPVEEPAEGNPEGQQCAPLALSQSPGHRSIVMR